MARRYVAGSREQGFLLPVDVREWLPEQDLAWTVVDAVAQLDLSGFEVAYRGDGRCRPPYDPQMMLALVLFAYCDGVRSSRAIEARCERDVAYRVITANLAPDHATIARFRATHRAAIVGVFVQVLRLLAEAGMVRVGLVAVDGSKMRGNASGTQNRTAAQLEVQLAEMTGQVEAMLAEAEAVDAGEDAEHGRDRGDEPPEGLRRRQDRVAALAAAQARLAKQEAETALAAQDAQDARRAQWEANQAAGKRQGRRPGKNPPKTSETAPPRVNLTDPDSKVMESHGTFCQGYNGQIVTTSDQVLLAADLTNCSADTPSLHPMLDQTRSNLDAVGVTDPIRATVADSGYGGAANLSEPTDPILLVSTRTGRRKDRSSNPPKNPAIARMTRRLNTPAGTALYRRRAGMIEPCFGQIKNRLGSFLHYRGLNAAKAEWTLIATSHNLLKYWRGATPAI